MKYGFTKALRHQLEFIKEDNVLFMLGVYFISILKKLSLYVSNLNIKWSPKKYFPLIKSPSQHIKLWCKIHKLLLPPIIQHFKFRLCESFQLFQVVSLLFAQVTGLLHTRFDLACRRLGRHEVVSRVLQDAYPTESTHAFTVSAVVLHLFFGVVRARFGEGLWDLVGCGLYT